MTAHPSLPPRRPYSFGPLYDLLVEVFPNHRSKQNVFDVPGFAKDLGYSHEALYKAIRQRACLRQNLAIRIIQLSRTSAGSRPLYWSDLVGFVLDSWEELNEPVADSGIPDLDDLLN